MIYSLTGKIIKKTLNAVVICCGGVGYYAQCPASVAGALSVMEPDRVALAISAGDHKAFKAASGVGPKLAQRIVLELKDKVAKGFAAGIDLENVAGAASDTAAAQGAGQAIAALVSLGYSQSEAALAVSKIDGTLPVEEIIKLALRSMAGRR